MFNISFPEIAVILAVCLIVVGPKRLPEMARFCGHLLGRVNRQVRSLRADIKREMDIEDLRSIVKDTERDAHAAAAELNSALDPVRTTAEAALRSSAAAESDERPGIKSAPAARDDAGPSGQDGAGPPAASTQPG